MTANTIIGWLIQLFMPKSIAKMREELKRKQLSYNSSVRSYQSLSNSIKDEIDKNHFSPYLRYEKDQS